MIKRKPVRDPRPTVGPLAKRRRRDQQRHSGHKPAAPIEEASKIVTRLRIWRRAATDRGIKEFPQANLLHPARLRLRASGRLGQRRELLIELDGGRIDFRVAKPRHQRRRKVVDQPRAARLRILDDHGAHRDI